MKPKSDTLGSRMKKYENTTQFLLSPRTYTILRVDGRAFHTWTRGLAKPYDADLMDLMDAAACQLCHQISGSRFAFVQSDEINLLAVDFLDIKTEPWFDGNVQKWASVGASIATMAFNLALGLRLRSGTGTDPIDNKVPNATFDARVYSIPDFIEVENYFVWRQQDAERNSVSMLAQHYASHKQLHGKNRDAQHEIIHAAGDDWAKHPASFKHGRCILKQIGRETGAPNPPPMRGSNWFVDDETPVFTRKRGYLRELIPIQWEDDMIVRKAATGK